MKVEDAQQHLEEKGKDITRSTQRLARAGAALQAVALSGAEFAKTTKGLGTALRTHEYANGGLGHTANSKKKARRKKISTSRKRNRR